MTRTGHDRTKPAPGAARVADLALAAALVACAGLSIASAPWALDRPWLNFAFKPLATLVVIAYAWRRRGGRAELRRWVLVGLVFSLGGDVALMWPRQGFLPGLVSFLLAHLAYLWAFTRERRLASRAAPYIVYAALAALILRGLWPGVPTPLRLPVLAYVACLASMAAQAAVLWRSGVARAGRLALGGALFLASDALLATNRFAQPVPLASLWILTSYWAAQWCIANGLADAPPAPRPPT